MSAVTSMTLSEVLLYYSLTSLRYVYYYTLILFFPAMMTEYLSHIQKAFVDLMECIEVKSDNPSDPSRLAVRMKYRLNVILSVYLCRLCLP